MSGVQFRPTFAALVAAEQELGPLFALVERASAGQLSLSELIALFWHCRSDGADTNRETFSEEMGAKGLAALTIPLRQLLTEILLGSCP